MAVKRLLTPDSRWQNEAKTVREFFAEMEILSNGAPPLHVTVRRWDKCGDMNRDDNSSSTARVTPRHHKASRHCNASRHCDALHAIVTSGVAPL